MTSKLTISSGEMRFPKGMVEIKAFIFCPKDKREYPLFAHASGLNREGKVEGLSVERGPMTLARAGVPRERGGSFTLHHLTMENQTLIKLQVKQKGWLADRFETFYIITREGGAVGNINFLKIPVVDPKTQDCYERKEKLIVNGQFEVIDIKKAEVMFNFKVPDLYRKAAINSRLEGIVRVKIVKEATTPMPTMQVASVRFGDGKERKVVKRARPVAKAPTKLNKEEK